MDPYGYSGGQDLYGAEQAVGMGIPSTGLMDTGSGGGYVDTGAFTYPATEPTVPPAPVAQPTSPFKFGIEIELAMGGLNNKKYKTWKALAEAVSKRLRKARLPHHVEPKDKPEMYEKWSVVRENSIREEVPKYTHGIELVSPIFRTDSNWWQDMKAIFERALPNHFELVDSDKTATHIHISRDPPLSTEELASLVKLALYYEESLDKLVPQHRQGTDPYWAQSNSGDKNPALRGLPLTQRLQTVDRALLKAQEGGQGSTSAAATARTDKRNKPVVKVMNLYDGASNLGLSGKSKDGKPFINAKGYKWDFAGMIPLDGNIKGSGRGTVEFRQPPGSLRAEHAATWILLGCAFVAGAVVADPSQLHAKPDGRGGSLEELEAFLYAGAAHLGWTKLYPLDELIQCAREERLPWSTPAGMEWQETM